MVKVIKSTDKQIKSDQIYKISLYTVWSLKTFLFFVIYPTTNHPSVPKYCRSFMTENTAVPRPLVLCFSSKVASGLCHHLSLWCAGQCHPQCLFPGCYVERESLSRACDVTYLVIKPWQNVPARERCFWLKRTLPNESPYSKSDVHELNREYAC